MGKRLFISAAVFSLTIWLAASAMWIRSYWRTDFVYMWTEYVPDLKRWTKGPILVSERHKVWLVWPMPEFRKSPHMKRQMGFSSEPARAYMVGDDSNGVLGVHHEVMFYIDSPCANLFAIDYATMFIVASLLPALAFWRWWNGSRYRGEGLCRKCGYDLRATPDRCPECGTIDVKATV